jgi:hypothetical protein
MVDFLICYNQLAYVGIANALKHEKINELKGISYVVFKKNKLNGLICSLDKIKFRGLINPDNFSGIITVDEIRRIKSTYFIDTSFNFENKLNGKMMLAFK